MNNNFINKILGTNYLEILVYIELEMVGMSYLVPQNTDPSDSISSL